MVDDFPVGQKVIFLGDHAYGVAAQVKSVSDESLNINIAVSSCARRTLADIAVLPQ